MYLSACHRKCRSYKGCTEDSKCYVIYWDRSWFACRTLFWHADMYKMVVFLPSNLRSFWNARESARGFDTTFEVLGNRSTVIF
jgi:hypothetical protein